VQNPKGVSGPRFDRRKRTGRQQKKGEGVLKSTRFNSSTHGEKKGMGLAIGRERPKTNRPSSRPKASFPRHFNGRSRKKEEPKLPRRKKEIRQKVATQEKKKKRGTARNRMQQGIASSSAWRGDFMILTLLRKTQRRDDGSDWRERKKANR